jgi:hypothetical protein
MALGWALLDGGDDVAAEAVFAETLAYIRESDWPPHSDSAPDCVIGLAATAASQRHIKRALRLAGAAARMRELIGRPVIDSEQGLGDAWLQPLQHSVDQASFEEWTRGGRALSMTQAVVYALEPPDANRSRMCRSSSEGYA